MRAASLNTAAAILTLLAVPFTQSHVAELTFALAAASDHKDLALRLHRDHQWAVSFATRAAVIAQARGIRHQRRGT